MACSGGYLLASAADHIFVSIFSTGKYVRINFEQISEYMH